MSQENKAQNTEVEITPVDIINAKQIIKLAMERGNAFTAEELVDVAQVFAKLDAFAKGVEAQSKAAQEASQSAPEETEQLPE